MKKLFLLLITVSLSYGEIYQPFIDANNKFAIDLYKSSSEENLFFSPYSISTCMSMAYVGARKETSKEIKKTFHFDFRKANLPLFVSELQKLYADSITIANGLWIDNDLSLKNKFQKIMENDFQTEIKQVTFQKECIEDINNFVKIKTHDKINNILNGSDIDSTTKMVMVNAIHFQKQWRLPFDEKLTEEGYFYPDKGEKSSVKMMNRQHRFDYMENEFMQMISLPFYESSISFLILLPKKEHSLSELNNLLSFENLDYWMSQMKKQKIALSVPKMHIDGERISLKERLNMPIAFSEVADFSNIAENNNFYISKALHKAFLDVDEKGVEAAAATALVFNLTCSLSHPEKLFSFKADHPFIFMIVDSSNKNILFIGRLCSFRN